MEVAKEPAFAWYRLEGRESALILVISLIFFGLCFIVFLSEDSPAPVPVTSTTVSPAIVHVNRAGVAELASLPGIGQRKAEKIVAARAQGPLRNLEEMARAAGGIPQTSRDRMQPFVRFED